MLIRMEEMLSLHRQSDTKEAPCTVTYVLRHIVRLFLEERQPGTYNGVFNCTQTPERVHVSHHSCRLVQKETEFEALFEAVRESRERVVQLQAELDDTRAGRTTKMEGKSLLAEVRGNECVNP